MLSRYSDVHVLNGDYQVDHAKQTFKGVPTPHLFLSVEADGDRLRISTLNNVLQERHPHKSETKG